MDAIQCVMRLLCALTLIYNINYSCTFCTMIVFNTKQTSVNIERILLIFQKKTIKMYQGAIRLNIHATWIDEEIYLRTMMWKLVVNLIRKYIF